MEVELLTRARIQDIEREFSRIRLAAAVREGSQRHRAAPDGRPPASLAMPRRVLRALRQAV
jgi:hypothetical protein